MKFDDIVELQQRLNAAGYGPIQVDGIYGEETHRASLAMAEALAGPGTLPIAPASKPWWRSKATVFGLTAAVSAVLGLLKIDVDWSSVQSLVDQALGAADQVLTVVAAVIALYGTVKRDAPIDPTLVLPGKRLKPSKDRRMMGADRSETAEPRRGFWADSGDNPFL